MKVTFSVNNNKKIVVLPFVSDDAYSIDYGSANNEELDSVAGSSIIALGSDPLARVSLSGIFPARKESWMESDMLTDPQEYVTFFRLGKKNRTIFRLVITRNDGKGVFNRLVACTSLKIDPPKTNGDIPYSMDFTEYRKASTKKA